MSQPLALPHRIILQKYLKNISLEAKKLKACSTINFCKAREKIIKNSTPFDSSDSLSKWAATQERLLNNLEVDPSRLAALRCKSSSGSYYAFAKNIQIVANIEGPNRGLVIRPAPETFPTHTTWVGFTEKKQFEIREPTNDVKVDAHIGYLNLLGKSVYVIDSIEDFARWSSLWGGNCVVSESVLMSGAFDCSLRESMLNQFIVKRDELEDLRVQCFLRGNRFNQTKL